MSRRHETQPPDRNHGRRAGALRPDTVLLRQELCWTAAAMLGFAMYGYAEGGGAAGGAIGAGTGYLLQQASYRLTVRVLWSGWRSRFVTEHNAGPPNEVRRQALRAFTLWMRNAGFFDRVYVAFWNARLPDSVDHEKGFAGRAVEYRVWLACERAELLGRYPLRGDNLTRRRLRRSLQHDEANLLQLATGERLKETE